MHKSDLFNWKISRNVTPDKNWDGRYIKRVPSKGRWISQFRIEELIEEKLSVEEVNAIYDTDASPIKTFLDIEIELIDDTFPHPDKAKMPVNLITFCNDRNKCFVLTTMKKDDRFFNKEEVNKMSDEVHDYFKNAKPIEESDKDILCQKFDIKYVTF